MNNVRENIYSHVILFLFLFVHIAKKDGLVEYQQSGFPAISSSKRRRISSQDSPDDHLSDAKGKVAHAQVCADQACVGATSAHLAEVTVFHTEVELWLSA